MASWYQEYGHLSQRTMDAYRRYGRDPHNIRERLDFYLTYLEDVVPYEVGVHMVPNHLQPYDLGASSRLYTEREEIQLRCQEGIFMTGIIQLGTRSDKAEEIAATLAYTQWRQGFHVRYHHQAWGVFTGLHQIRFCSSRDGMDWDRTADFHPIHDAQEVVAYFEREFARIRHH